MTQTDLFWMALFMIAALFSASAWASHQGAAAESSMVNDLAKQLQVGDVVFIRIPRAPFTKVADTTSSWTNHVGIVSDVSGAEPLIAESRVPLSGETTWSRFVKRSETGRVAVARLDVPLNEKQKDNLKQAVKARRGILYDTGFDLHSSRQFCSRFVREVLDDATGVKLGEVQNFAALLQHNPEADQTFWRMWYFGNIPWQRETVTPASLIWDEKLIVYFDGYAYKKYSGNRTNTVRFDSKGSNK
jgi:hypothetical protein